MVSLKAGLKMKGIVKRRGLKSQGPLYDIEPSKYIYESLSFWIPQLIIICNISHRTPVQTHSSCITDERGLQKTRLIYRGKKHFNFFTQNPAYEITQSYACCRLVFIMQIMIDFQSCINQPFR